ncbi:MAG: DUF559 domain-containing protein [Nitrospinae bacterium]|nr:DUF559 domain-containing protein [Nitrospinota bacterium]
MTNVSTVDKNYKYKEIYYLDTSSITKGEVESLQSMLIIDAPSRAKRLVKDGSIVYSTVRPIQRHYGIIYNPLENLIVSTGFTVIDCIEGKSTTKYIYYLLSSNNVVQKLDVIANGSTSTYPSIKPSDIENILFNLPPLSEQKAIADILSSFDEKIELLREQNKTLETLAQTIFKEWFVNFEFPHTPKAPPRQAPPATPPKEGNNSPPLEGCPKGGVVVTQNNPIPINNEQQSQQPPKKRNLRDTKAFMSLPYNPELKARARELRKAGNLAEVLFWLQVKKHQFHELDFDRQKIIGNYIVDFYCASLRLVVEIDGGSHNDKQEYDKKRDDFLEGLGLTVIHVLDRDVRNNIQAVMGYLEKWVVFCGDEGGTQNHHPALRAPLQGRGIGYKSAGGEMVESELGEIPKGWRVGKLGDSIKTNASSINKSSVLDVIQYLDTGSITEGYIELTQELHLADAPSRARRIVRHNDILISTVRPNLKHYGLLKEPDKNLIVSTGFCVITCDSIDPHFVYYLLTASDMTDYLHSVAEGSTSTYPSIKPSDIEKVEFIQPPKSLLKLFSAYTDKAWNKIIFNQNQIKTLSITRDTLLPKLMSGEIRVKGFEQ